jgi:hypothetical protein
LLQIIKAVLLKLQIGLSQHSPQSAVSRIFTVTVMAVVHGGSGLKRKQRLLLGTVANYNAQFCLVVYLF